MCSEKASLYKHEGEGGDQNEPLLRIRTIFLQTDGPMVPLGIDYKKTNLVRSAGIKPVTLVVAEHHPNHLS